MALRLRADQIARNAHVNLVVLRMPNNELCLAEVDIDLQFEVGREEIRDTGLLAKLLREPPNPVLHNPLDHLAIVYFVALIGVLVVSLLRFFDKLCHSIDTFFWNQVSALVDCGEEIVDHLHHVLGVLAQVEVLDGVCVDVPVHVLKFISCFRSDHVEKELEA